MPSESSHILFFGIRLPLQQPHIVHNCVNQVIENTKLSFFGSQLIEKSCCISVEQVNILDAAAVQTTAGHDKAFINKHSLVEHQCNH
jgi:uncharacterized protein YggL (DUF469 family)